MTNLAFDMTPERDETAPRAAGGAADPAHHHPGLLRHAGDRRHDRDRRRRPQDGAGACEGAHRRPERGRRVLPLGPDAEPHPGRDPAALRRAGHHARQPRRGLRRRHQGHGDRPFERRPALSRAPEARRLRISGRAGRRDDDHRRHLRHLPRSRQREARPGLRLHRRQGRRRLLDRSPTTSPGRWRA